MPLKKTRPSVKITNSKTFEAAIWTALEPYARSWSEQRRTWRKTMLANNPGLRPVPPAPLRIQGDALLLLRIFQQFFEITTSFAALANIPFYIKHFPPALSKRITRPVWVRYHSENYLHELYVFDQRVTLFFNVLRKKYKQADYASKLNDACDVLHKDLKDIIEANVKARGAHVHERRLDDPVLTSLEAQEFLFRFKQSSAKNYFDWFLDAKQEKVFFMTMDNARLKKWLNQCGLVLGGLLFDSSGSFRYPPAGFGQKS
jgi:hypothetical protein